MGLQDTIFVAIPGYNINDIKDVMTRLKKDIGPEGIKLGRRPQRDQAKKFEELFL